MKALVFAAVLLGLATSVASAGGVNLAWNDCYGASFTTNKTFACNTNTGASDLYVSFDPNAMVPDAHGATITIDLQSASTPLPQWWQLKNAGSCRPTSLTTPGGMLGTCEDPWVGQSTRVIGSYLVTANTPSLPTNRAQIVAYTVVADVLAREVNPGTEYLGIVIRILDTGTVGTSCLGCQDPVCLVLNQLVLHSNTLPDQTINAPLA